MILTLEGLDCCGKSFLRDYLSKKLNYIKFKNDFHAHIESYTDKNSDWESVVCGMNIVLGQTYNTFNNFIKDRFFISEYVYSKYYKRNMRISLEELEKCGKDKNIIIFIDVSYENHIKISKLKNENSFTIKEFNEQRNLFFEALNKTTVPFIIIKNSSTFENFKTNSLEILNEIRKLSS